MARVGPRCVHEIALIKTPSDLDLVVSILLSVMRMRMMMSATTIDLVSGCIFEWLASRLGTSADTRFCWWRLIRCQNVLLPQRAVAPS
jgi:hypothetical protein